MNSFINKKLISLLEEHKNTYNKELNAFLEKNQIQSNISNVLIEQFENENYLNDFSKKFIPLIVKQLMMEKNNVITNYLPYILEKYQLFIKGEVVQMKTCLEEDYRELIKKIDIDFSNNLLKLNKETEVDKKEYIESFVLEVKDKIEGMSNFNPELLLKALSKIRNPKLQYEFLNVNNNNIDSIKEYIVSLDDTTFKNIVYNYFSYPLDMTVEEYHKKWIGKDKIHIKFAKNILNERYELAKNILKNYSDEEQNDLVLDKNNGIKLHELVEEPVKEVQKTKSKVKTKSLVKKESSLSSFLKKFTKK